MLHCVAWHSLYPQLADAKSLRRQSSPSSPESAPERGGLGSESAQLDAEKAFRSHAPSDQEFTQLRTGARDDSNGDEQSNPPIDDSGGPDNDRESPCNQQAYGQEISESTEELDTPTAKENEDEDFDTESAR